MCSVDRLQNDLKPKVNLRLVGGVYDVPNIQRVYIRMKECEQTKQASERATDRPTSAYTTHKHIHTRVHSNTVRSVQSLTLMTIKRRIYFVLE